MDEIILFTRVRPDTPGLAEADRAAARGRLLAAAGDERTAARKAARRRRVGFAAVPVAAAAIVAAGIAFWPGQAGTAGTVSAGLGPLHPDAHALAFTTSDGYITVVVRDPLADQASYNAEFRAHRLNVTLSLVPVSPSLVGTVVEISTSGPGGNSITTITAAGRCWTGGGGSQCPVGVRIPVGYRGQADIVFGRAARTGEQYESTTDADAPGEVMHGLAYQGRSVAAVLAMLRPRHVTVPTYRYDGQVLSPGQVPGTWYVYDAVPWAPGQVLLFVGPKPYGSVVQP
jgi:hypothetical protein